MKPIPGTQGARRLEPKLWDYNYWMMKRLGAALRRSLAQYLEGHGDMSVLDFGCGTTPYRPLVEGYGARYLGADIADNGLAEIHLDELGCLPVNGASIDVVLSSQVLEHVIDVATYLNECWRVLKDDGILLLSTHGMWVYHPFPYDVRRWTWWGLRHEIETRSFDVISCQGIVGPLAYTTQLRLQLVRGLLYQFGKVGQVFVPLICALSQCFMALEDLVTPRKVGQENSAIYFIVAKKRARQPEKRETPARSKVPV